MLFSLKYIDLQQQGTAVKEKLEQTVAELETRLAERENSGDTVAEVRGNPNPLRGNLPVSPTSALFTFSFLTEKFIAWHHLFLLTCLVEINICTPLAEVPNEQ